MPTIVRSGLEQPSFEFRSLTKLLVNHARPSDITEGYAADWTVDQLREPAQRIADRIDELTANVEFSMRKVAGAGMAGRQDEGKR